MSKEDKMLLMFFYLGKMKEAGFVETLGHALSEKGFDRALEIYNSGEKLVPDDLFAMLMAIGVPEDQIEMFAGIIIQIQEVGYEKILADFEAFKEQNPHLVGK